jgi:hypothetical protein
LARAFVSRLWTTQRSGTHLYASSFVSIHFTSLLLNNVAGFLNGLSCAGTRKAQDGVRLQPISAPEQWAHESNFL